MYHNLSNCTTCGRLIAPSSGLLSANRNYSFCCKRCLNEYYNEQPGLWEQEEQEELLQQELHQAYLEDQQIEEQERLEKLESDRIYKRNTCISLFIILFLLALLICNFWFWLLFIVYCLFLLNRWSNS